MRTSTRPHTTKYPTTCARCDRAMPAGSAYVLRKGQPIHPHCAPGADDE